MGVNFAFPDLEMERISQVRIRSYNCTQFVSRTVKLFLSSSNIDYEGYILPLQRKTHTQSFSSILENKEIGKFKFSSFEDEESTIIRFIALYKHQY